jgi:hypothetical protein
MLVGTYIADLFEQLGNNVEKTNGSKERRQRRIRFPLQCACITGERISVLMEGLPRRDCNDAFVRKIVACFVTCLWILIGIPFGPETLPTLVPIMAGTPPTSSLISVNLLGHTHIHSSPHWPSQFLRDPTGRSPAKTELQRCLPGLLSRNVGAGGGGLGEGIGTRISVFIIFRNDFSTLFIGSSQSLHGSYLQSFSRYVNYLWASWPGHLEPAAYRIATACLSVFSGVFLPG